MSHPDSSQQLTRTDPRGEATTCASAGHPTLLYTLTPPLYTRLPTVANCERTVTACIQSGGIYALTNVKAQNSCLDLSGGDNYSIIGFRYHGGHNQAWIFDRQYNGNYLIKSVGFELYLNIEGEPRDGARVVVKSTPFEWRVEDQPGFRQAIRLFVPGTNQNVDLSDYGNPAPGAPVTLWGKWQGEHQVWRVESIGGTHRGKAVTST